MKNVKNGSKFHDKRPFLPFFCHEWQVMGPKEVFYTYLVPEMIRWKFHENRMLASAKTKLPSLLWPAEWKEPAPFNCTRAAHIQNTCIWSKATSANRISSSVLPVMLKSSNLLSLCDYLSSLINVSNFSDQHRSKVLIQNSHWAGKWALCLWKSH